MFKPNILSSLLALAITAAPGVGDTIFYTSESGFNTDAALLGVTFRIDSFEAETAASGFTHSLLNAVAGVEYRIPDAGGFRRWIEATGRATRSDRSPSATSISLKPVSSINRASLRIRSASTSKSAMNH